MEEGVIYRLLVTPSAATQAKNAAQFYGAISAKLEAAFREEVEQKLISL
jgi:hypothetical protein